MSNKLIETFLANPKMNELYKNYLTHPTEENKLIIETHFTTYVKKIKILTYFSKVLHFEAQRFDKKIRNLSNSNFQYTDGLKEDTVLYEALPSNHDRSPFDAQLKNAQQLENLFEDKHLYTIISDLNPKNKKLLYLLFVIGMSESEVASHLGITKQAVNKRKKDVLQKIREKYFN
jgi:RNA polymerase sigma factor (sigma-70 family)